MKWAFAFLAILLASPAALAEHADIDLKVFRVDPATGKSTDEVAASADQEPPAGGSQKRPVFKVKAGEPLVLQFIYINTYPHGIRKNVSVRYLVVREKELRQKDLPELGDNVVTQGKFGLTFKPKTRVGARVVFTIREPGIYLVRVESLNTGSDHEHFSAIDLRVE